MCIHTHALKKRPNFEGAPHGSAPLNEKINEIVRMLRARARFSSNLQDANNNYADHFICKRVRGAQSSCTPQRTARHHYVCSKGGLCGQYVLRMGVCTARPQRFRFLKLSMLAEMSVLCLREKGVLRIILFANGGGGCAPPNPPPRLFNRSCAPQRTACHHYVCSKALFGGSCVLKTGGLHAPQRSCFTKQSVLAAKGIMSLLFLLRQCHAITQIILFAHGCGCDPPTPPASFTSSCTPQRTARHHYVCSKGRICGS